MNRTWDPRWVATADPRHVTTVAVNLFTLAGGNRVAGYLVGAFPAADPSNRFRFGLSRTDGPASGRLWPGSYYFFAEREGARVSLDGPIDIGGFGVSSRDLDLTID